LRNIYIENRLVTKLLRMVLVNENYKNPRTLTWHWALIILGMALVLAIGPVLLDWSVLREQGLFDTGPEIFLLIGFIFGALEEPGWRGYAQEGLQRRIPVFWANLVAGIF
jgi:uncharacterized protein